MYVCVGRESLFYQVLYFEVLLVVILMFRCVLELIVLFKFCFGIIYGINILAAKHLVMSFDNCMLLTDSTAMGEGLQEM